jgi:hypothetical protein
MRAVIDEGQTVVAHVRQTGPAKGDTDMERSSRHCLLAPSR